MKLQNHQSLVQFGGPESFGHGGKGRGHGWQMSRKTDPLQRNFLKNEKQTSKHLDELMVCTSMGKFCSHVVR